MASSIPTPGCQLSLFTLSVSSVPGRQCGSSYRVSPGGLALRPMIVFNKHKQREETCGRSCRHFRGGPWRGDFGCIY